MQKNRIINKILRFIPSFQKDSFLKFQDEFSWFIGAFKNINMAKRLFQINNKFKIVYLLLIVSMLLPMSGCYLSTTPDDLQHVYDQFGLNFPLGKKVYLAHDIWYQQPMDISFVNYQQGKILPFGSEIEFIEAYPDYVVFKTVNDNAEYKIINDPQASLLSNAELFHQLFTTVNPNTKTAKMSDEVITKLKQGKIEVGMTRDQVLLALGPPPRKMTPPNTKVTWIYFLKRPLTTTHVVFKGNKVSYVFNN